MVLDALFDIALEWVCIWCPSWLHVPESITGQHLFQYYLFLTKSAHILMSLSISWMIFKNMEIYLNLPPKHWYFDQYQVMKNVQKKILKTANKHQWILDFMNKAIFWNYCSMILPTPPVPFSLSLLWVLFQLLMSIILISNFFQIRFWKTKREFNWLLSQYVFIEIDTYD